MNLEQRKPDVTEWAKKAQEFGLPLDVDMATILQQSVDKKERLQKSGLPMGVVHGPFDTFEEMEKEVPKEKRDQTRYFIRCVPKNYKSNEGLQICRQSDVSWVQARDYYRGLSGGANNYTVQLFEIWKPDYSGGVVVNSGRVMVDLEKGDRFFTKEGEAKEVRGLSLDVTGEETGKLDIHSIYLNSPSEEEKEIMLKALKYLNPNLDREIFEKLKVYADYFYSYEKGFKFVDFIEAEEAEPHVAFNRPDSG